MLPNVQVKKFFTLFGSLKYCKTDIIELVKKPSITPISSTETMSFNQMIIIEIMNSIIIAPSIEANIIAQYPFELLNAKTPVEKDDANINIPTPKPAPLLTPKIEASAKGFLKRVCINKPHIETPAPINIAISALGNLMFNIISWEDSFTSLFKKVAKISPNVIEILPTLKSTKKIIIVNIDNKIKR